jgi:DNA modification methylase
VIICGEASKIMAGFEEGCIDLSVTSPPYDDLREYKGYTFDFEAIAQQLWRVTKPGGVVVWVVGDATVKGSETGESFRQALRFMEIGFSLFDTMIYQKFGFAYPSNDKYHQVFEYMFILSKGPVKTFNPIIDHENITVKRGGGKARDKDGAMRDGGNGGLKLEKYGKRWNVWYYSVGGNKTTKDKIAFQHPAIFPEQLAADHIRSWSNEGDIVLDCMAGSGTVLKAARILGRKFIGIEISEEYVAIAEERLSQSVLDFK